MSRSGKKILTRVFLLDNCEKISKATEGVYFSNCGPGQHSSCHLVVLLLCIHTRAVLKGKSAAPAPEKAQVLQEVA